ncbi:MAG: ROK family protein [Velocimicrobium sp.]
MNTYIAFDIGGTMIKYGLLEEDGTIIYADECKTQAKMGGAHIMDSICEKIAKLSKQKKLSGVAISTAGMVDPIKGSILYANDNIPNYTGTPIKEIIERTCKLPCEVENDVACAALSEQRVGAAKGSKVSFCVTVGTGIGGCVLIDGNVFYGAGNSAGHLGYMNVFGSQFEKVASSSAMVDTVNLEKNRTKTKDRLDGKTIIQLAKDGDEVCIRAIDKMCDILGYGIANVCCVLNPEVVVLGGGIMTQKEYLNDRMQTSLDKYLHPAIRKNTRLTFAQNGNQAGLIGAYFNFKGRQL